MKHKRRALGIAAISVIALFIAVSVLTPFTMNCWLVLTGRGFEIPDESSLFTFNVAEMNSGSGEWWLYGEDRNYFYSYGQESGVRYHAFPKSDIGDCPGFDRVDFTTWCDSFTIDQPHETRAEQGDDAN